MSQNKSELWWLIYRFFQLDKDKKATINPINDDNFFQYAATVELNYEKSRKYLERI